MSEVNKARIFQLEDEPDTVRQVNLLISSGKLGEVILLAHTVQEALNLVPKVLLEKEINIALLDNKLPDGSGESVATAIRNSQLPIAIISFSSVKQKWAYLNVAKYELVSELPQAIRSGLKMNSK